MLDIRWDWDPQPGKSLVMDIETQSAVNLPAAGRKIYMADPTTRLMIAQFMHPDGHVEVWVPPGRMPKSVQPSCCLPMWRGEEYANVAFYFREDMPPRARASAEKGDTWIAHNAEFDAHGWAMLDPCKNMPQPRAWHDTLPCARAGGWPGKLKLLGERIVGEGKDPGEDCLPILFRAKVKGNTVQYCVGTPPLWEAVLRYAVKDVLLLGEVAKAVAPYGEPDVLLATGAINRRGLAFDRKMLKDMLDLWHEAEAAACARVRELTGGEITERNLRSVPQVRAWLKREGFKVDSLDKRQLDQLFEDPASFFEGEAEDGAEIDERGERVVEVLRARQTATRAAKGKIAKVFELGDSDDRVRDWAIYHGAHTGRYTSYGVQLHNMLRGVGDLDVEGLIALQERGELTLEAIQAAAAKCKGKVRMDDALATIFRPVFWAPPGKRLRIGDFASIEARLVAWFAGEESLLELFRDPHKDVYLDMAGKIFGRICTKADKKERFVGKTTILGAGYQMSHNKFARLCEAQGIDLAAAGTTAELCITTYRNEYKAIAGKKGLWRNLQTAATKCVVTGRDQYTNKCEFKMRSGALELELPSGRCLRYHEAKIEDVVPGYCKLLGLPEVPKPTLTYLHHHGWRAPLYGGIITENVCQAAGRDILADKLVEGEMASMQIVAHVHDEIVDEEELDSPLGGPEGLRTFARWLSTPPAWAAGLPLGCEVFSSPRYVKTPYKNAHVVAALLGRVTEEKNA